MISRKMAEKLTQQVNAEFYSAYLYMAMSSYADFVGYKGAARWLAVQAQEETAHGMKFAGYLQSQGEHVLMRAIAEPPAKFKSLKAIFEAVAAHEAKVTGMINDIANLAVQEKDHATRVAADWFVNEQVEEEENAREILAQLEMAGEHIGALMYIDKGLGERKAGNG